MPEYISIPLAVALIIGAIIFTLITFRGE